MTKVNAYQTRPSAASTSESDSSDDEVPIALKKPTVLKNVTPTARMSLSNQTKHVPRASSSDSDSSDNQVAFLPKNPMITTSTAFSKMANSVPPPKPASAVKLQAKRPAPTSSSDSSDNDQYIQSKKPSLVKPLSTSKPADSAAPHEHPSVAKRPAKRAAQAKSTESESSDDQLRVASKKPALITTVTHNSKLQTARTMRKTVPTTVAILETATHVSSSKSESSEHNISTVPNKPSLVKAMTTATKAASLLSVLKKPSAVTALTKQAPDASSSDSDSSDDDVPVVSKKPAMGKATTPNVKTPAAQPMSKAGSVAKAGAKPSGPASSSDSDSSDDDVPVVSKKASKSKSWNAPDAAKLSSVGDVSSFSEESAVVSKIGIDVCNGGGPWTGPRIKKRAVDSSSVHPDGATSGPKFARLDDGSRRRSAPSDASVMRNTPYRRVTEDEVSLDPRLADNSYEALPNARSSWGERANRDFKFTQGKSFKHEKTKKKRGSYFGGSISTDVCSFKFED